jgi:3-phosphoshikimate 1-carboxyvinyltransferase
MIEIKPIEKRFDLVLDAPPSKAYTLRALFIAALADGKSIIRKPLIAEDQEYAINALRQFGIEIEVKDDSVVIHGTNGTLKTPEEEVFIGNSGVTARLLATFVGICDGKITINGTERMQSGRPMQDLLDALEPLGINAHSVKDNGCPPIVIEGGNFIGGTTKLKGDKSSQYFSSILVSAPYAKNDITIECIGDMSSKPYIDMTLDSMKEFGAIAENNDYKEFTVKSNQKYKAREYTVEGDYSNAAYFFAAAAITKSKVTVKNLKIDSAQGDKFFVDCLEEMGCKVVKGNDSITVEGAELKAIRKDMNNFPDIVQPLSVVAAFAKGKSEFTNIGHLKFKECDRLKAPATELKKMGINAVDTDDSLVVEGGVPHGAKIDTYNDHRMAMSFAIAGLKVPGIIIKNPENVKKSFPDFFERLKSFY